MSHTSAAPHARDQQRAADCTTDSHGRRIRFAEDPVEADTPNDCPGGSSSHSDRLIPLKSPEGGEDVSLKTLSSSSHIAQYNYPPVADSGGHYSSPPSWGRIRSPPAGGDGASPPSLWYQFPPPDANRAQAGLSHGGPLLHSAVSFEGVTPTPSPARIHRSTMRQQAYVEASSTNGHNPRVLTSGEVARFEVPAMYAPAANQLQPSTATTRILQTAGGPTEAAALHSLNNSGNYNNNSGGHYQRRRITVEDPGAYRPSTPILNWSGPKRSDRPPIIKLWVSLGLLCTAQLLTIGLIPLILTHDQLYVFHGLLIPGFTLITMLLTYMSMTRHVNKLADLLQSINSPTDMDRVVESLQNGRFSRFEETWKLQVETIRMFCRMLKYHHGVNPVSGEILEWSDDEDMRSSDIRTHSWRQFPPAAAVAPAEATSSVAQRQRQYSANTVHRALGAAVVPMEGHAADSGDLANTWNGQGARTLSVGFDDSATMYSCGSPTGSIHLPLSPDAVGSATNPIGGGTAFAGPPAGADLPISAEQPACKRAGSNPGSSPTRRRSTLGGNADEPFPETSSADPLDDNARGWDEVLGPAPEDQRSLVFTFLKNIKPDVELSKTPLPVQVLEPRSLLEKLSDLFVHPRAFANIARSAPGQDRLVAILKWFFSAYHVKPTGAKKPFNPVLGETFECYFARGTPDEIHYLAEQVSHHPPITVFTVVHRESRVALTGSFYPKPKLVSPNVGASIVDGRIEIRVPLTAAPASSALTPTSSSPSGSAARGEEVWVLNMPSAFIGGLLSGTMRVELGGNVSVASDSSEFAAQFEFQRKGWLGGAYDAIKGDLTKGTNAYRPIEGRWSERVTLGGTKKGTSSGAADGGTVTLFDVDEEPPMRPFVPATSLGAKPSRLLWRHVTTAVRAGDSTLAQKAKEKLEGKQRDERRAREAHGEEYFPAHFRLAAAKKKPSEAQWIYIGEKRL